MTDISELDDLIDGYVLFNEEETAMDLGKALVLCSNSIKEKKEIFTHLFKMTKEDKAEAIINLWAVAVMIEDDLSIPKKVTAVRNLLEDSAVSLQMLEDWIRVVWHIKRAPADFLNFIAIDLRNILGIAEDLKEMLSQELPEED